MPELLYRGSVPPGGDPGGQRACRAIFPFLGNPRLAATIDRFRLPPCCTPCASGIYAARIARGIPVDDCSVAKPTAARGP
jgi:hypothetical protein